MTEAVVHIEAGNDFAEIRDSVRRVCADFPGAYWRKLEETGAYPSEFVQALGPVNTSEVHQRQGRS